MSSQAMTWAIGQKTGGPSAKTVLWSIANYANQHWCAWVSQKTIVEESEQSPDSVQRRIRDLEVLGLLRRIPLHFAGRKTIDFLILAPSPWFKAPLEEIKPFLPAGCVIEPKWAALHAAADCGSAETGTSDATLPQTLPQIAPDAAALVRQQEPLREPEKDSLSQRSSPELRPQREREISPSASGRAVFEVDPRFDEIATLWPAKDKLADARDLWARMTEADRDGAARYAPVFLAETGARRKYLEQLATWLRGQSWRFTKPAPAMPAAVALDPFSRPWWAEFWRRWAAGEKVHFMATEAMRGVAWTAPPPSEDAVKALVAVEVKAPAFSAWERFVESRGGKLPKPDQVPVIWCPAEHPTDWTAVAA